MLVLFILGFVGRIGQRPIEPGYLVIDDHEFLATAGHRDEIRGLGLKLVGVAALDHACQTGCRTGRVAESLFLHVVESTILQETIFILQR